PVEFVLVARPGTKLEDITVIAGHPVAYGQCRAWLDDQEPRHRHKQATSNEQATNDLIDEQGNDAAIAPLGIERHYGVTVLAEGIAENPDAITRFALVSRTAPMGEPTGADKTSLIVELPDDRAGALLEMLELFATRGVNLTLLA